MLIVLDDLQAVPDTGKQLAGLIQQIQQLLPQIRAIFADLVNEIVPTQVFR